MGRFAAAPGGSAGEPLHPQGHPFSRSYGVVLPSSLTMVLPIALVSSTRPPVSVLVRAPPSLPRSFSWEHGLAGFARSLRRRASGTCRAHFTARRPARFHRGVQNPARLSFSVTPSVIAVRRWCGNVHPLCIGYACRPRLSSRLTLGGLASPRKPWTCGGGVTLPTRATHASIRTPERSTEPVARPLRRVRDAPLPLRCAESAASVPCLAP